MATQKRSVSINAPDDKVDKVDRSAAKASDHGRRKDKDAKFKETWKVPARYEIKQLLGAGAYGKVCEAKDRDKKKRVAIKQAKHLLEDLIDAKRILREVAILSRVSHPHIVAIYDVVVPSDLVNFNELYIVLEICDSDLKKLIRADVTLTDDHVTRLLYNLLVGLNYLHSVGIWHRDLKPANCLVNEDCSVKICDFGLARAVGTRLTPELEGSADQLQKRHLTGHVVTRWYRAPELILLQEAYTESIDIWSVGCIYAELLGMLEGTRFADRSPLFPGHTCFPLSPHEGHKNDTRYYTKGSRDQLAKIFELIGTPSKEEIRKIDGDDAQGYLRCFSEREGTGVQNRFKDLSPLGSQLLERMLVFSPESRVTVGEALEHPLFAKIRNSKVETTETESVCLDFEKDEDLDEKKLRKYFLKECRSYHPEVPEM